MTPVDLAAHDTLAKLVVHHARAHGDAVAMREKAYGIWNTFTWAEVHDQVRTLALGLATLGLGRGDVVALTGRNRPNWLWSEWAAQALGAISLGLYEDILADEAAQLLNAAGARVVVCEDEEQVDKLLSLGERLPELRWIVFHDDRGMRKYADARLVGWRALRARGERLRREDPDRFRREVEAGRGEEVAALCTTSGTTSEPKLAMLGHGALLRHALRYLERDPRGPEDEYVSVLPLPWIMEQVYVAVMPLVSRIRVNFPERAETAMADLREIGPTHLLLAPRVWEQTAADVRARVMDAPRATRRLYDLAMRRGLEALDRGTRDRLAELVLFRALRDRLGFSRIKSAATGGAALGPDTFRFFLAMGVPLRQLYGQTELMGAYTLQDGREIEFDSSGRPFDGVEIRIDDPDANGVGEIVTRHPDLFHGYFDAPEATAEVVDAEGWLRTGDAGYLDPRGRLVVIDRVKDIATTRAGDRFSPQYIENKLKFSPYIGACVVLGHGRPFLAAIVCIRFSMVAKWAESHGVGYTTYADLAAKAAVHELVAGEVDRVNAGLPRAQSIRRFVLLFKELDPDDGELTRTRKIRRRVVDERYGELIRALYDGRERARIAAEVTFEDGRKGRVDVEMAIRDAADGSAEAA
ncbi:MAG: AMP-binding protein [Alphaproteobacteria bacterium]|jgi:long-chain acyl-CoA synthetase|nr:AMP-binding protein [Alphaproteobacteria bacterium]